MDMIEAAGKINYELLRARHMNLFGTKVILEQRVKDAAEDSKARGNNSKAAQLAQSIATFANALDNYEWEVGMTTKPGDVVFDPEKKYRYLYTGAEEMTHSNPLFYPGAQGVYYWSIIPNTKSFIKVYPDIPNLAVAVKHGEHWWNTEETAIFEWIGADNDFCVWPPVQGNEWKLVPFAE